MRKSLWLILLLAAGVLSAGEPDAAQLEWEKLIKKEGCLVFGTQADAVECGIFLEKDWEAFLKAAKNDEQRFRFVLSRFSSRKPTDIHICHIRNATEGEIAVFAAQRIVGTNWYDYYEGHVEEFKKIIGTVADDYPLERVLENTGACATLQRYFMAMRGVDELRAKAEKGDLKAQYDLGFRCGTAGDVKHSLYWYLKAAEGGYAEAQCDLGMLYLCGEGVPKDFGRAAFWFRKAADAGYPYAQFRMGELHYSGRGVKKDYEQAVFWFRKAAEQENVGGMLGLGDCYARGHGVTDDKKLAAYWYRKAAEKGHPRGAEALKKIAEEKKRSDK